MKFEGHVALGSQRGAASGGSSLPERIKDILAKDAASIRRGVLVATLVLAAACTSWELAYGTGAQATASPADGTGAQASSPATATGWVSPDPLAQVLGSRSLVTPTDALADARAGSLWARVDATLDRDADVAWLGRHATSATSLLGLDSFSAYHALALTTRSPSGSPFARRIAGALTAGFRAGEPYRGTVAKGAVPILYQWDERWGYTDYCGEPLGFTGCGVTTMAMAYMGITGRTDRTPADMARLATQLGEANGGTNATFFTNPAMTAELGIVGTTIADTPDALVAALAAGNLVVVNVRPNTLAGSGHYVLAVGLDADGSVRIHDPNSTDNTARRWDPAELVGLEMTMVSLHAA